jgi:hypothetical protein
MWTRSGNRRFRGAESAGVVALELPDLVTRPDGERSTLTPGTFLVRGRRMKVAYAHGNVYRRPSHYTTSAPTEKFLCHRDMFSSQVTTLQCSLAMHALTEKFLCHCDKQFDWGDDNFELQ